MKIRPRDVDAFLAHDEIPEALRCPLHRGLLRNPVRFVDDPHNTFDERDLFVWLKQRTSHPMTRACVKHVAVQRCLATQSATTQLRRSAARQMQRQSKAPTQPPALAARRHQDAAARLIQAAWLAWRGKQPLPVVQKPAPPIHPMPYQRILQGVRVLRLATEVAAEAGEAMTRAQQQAVDGIVAALYAGERAQQALTLANLGAVSINTALAQCHVSPHVRGGFAQLVQNGGVRAPAPSRQFCKTYAPHVLRRLLLDNDATVLRMLLQSGGVAFVAEAAMVLPPGLYAQASLMVSDMRQGRYCGACNLQHQPHGRGVLVDSQQAHYYGDWRHGGRHGRGAQYTAAMAVNFCGEWTNDMPGPYGMWQTPNGLTLCGHLQANYRALGQLFDLRSRIVACGSFVAGEIFCGEEMFANGRRFLGEKMSHGGQIRRGCFYHDGVLSYIGMANGAARHGPGVEFGPNESELFATWEADETSGVAVRRFGSNGNISVIGQPRQTPSF